MWVHYFLALLDPPKKSKTLFGDLRRTASTMFFLAFLFIFGAAAAFETNIVNNNTNVYDGLNDIDCVAVNSTTKCR